MHIASHFVEKIILRIFTDKIFMLKLALHSQLTDNFIGEIFCAQPMKCTKLSNSKNLWYTQMSENRTSMDSNGGQCVWSEIGRHCGYVPSRLTDLATS